MVAMHNPPPAYAESHHRQPVIQSRAVDAARSVAATKQIVPASPDLLPGRRTRSAILRRYGS